MYEFDSLLPFDIAKSANIENGFCRPIYLCGALFFNFDIYLS